MHLQIPQADSSPVSYDLSENAWNTHPQFLQELIRRHGVKRVGDIGGGANPVLAPEEIETLGIDYTLIDIEASELDKAPACYKKLIGDVTAPTCGEDNSFDLVFSTMLAEHVISGEGPASEFVPSAGTRWHRLPLLPHPVLPALRCQLPAARASRQQITGHLQSTRSGSESEVSRPLQLVPRPHEKSVGETAEHRLRNRNVSRLHGPHLLPQDSRGEKHLRAVRQVPRESSAPSPHKFRMASTEEASSQLAPQGEGL